MEVQSINMPNHIAMIMDGNRTWAKKRGLNPILGHFELVVALDKIIRHSLKLGIKQVSFYAFSTENWKRSDEEVENLMNIYNKFISEFSNKYEGIKFRLLGSKERLPEFLKNSIIKTEEKTFNNDEMIFNMALNYGGRYEILNSIKNLVKDYSNEKISLNEITEENFSKNLYTEGDVDPDLMIRTSGQERLSNFLPWQLSYSELYFTDVMWPDFDENELDKAIIEYQKRTRKFGGC